MRDIIRTRLVDGQFTDGRLPDETRLMSEYRVGRNVIRLALALLQAEGLIARTQGVGTMSLTHKTRLALRDANGLTPAVGAPMRIVTRVLSMATAPTPDVVADRLDAEPGSPCLGVDVITYIDGEPAVLLTSYVADPDARQRMCGGLAVGGWAGDWYEFLTSVDLRPTRRDTVTEAVCLDGIVASILDARPGDAAIRVQRRLTLGDDSVVEFGYAYSRGDRIVFAVSDGVLEGSVQR